jgi:3-oxoacyl-(acyl-carrier-protein) synthase
LRGIPGIEDDTIVGATVDLPQRLDGRLKVLPLCEIAAAEAFEDAGVDLSKLDLDQFGCSIGGHMGDTSWMQEQAGLPLSDNRPNWWGQWIPNTACSMIARKYGLRGPRQCNSTACSTSLISVMTAVRSIRDRQCDIMLAGGADALDPVVVAGFNRMRVLANDVDPNRACRPFDRTRKGFVFGEGSAMFVIERLGHALRRGARIYAEIKSFSALAQAYHVTGVDPDSDALDYLIQSALKKAHVQPSDIGYINAHGTGTMQNDAAEAAGICRTFGKATEDVCVSATKSILGHMINAAGAAELAVTALGLRDGFAPPTLNLHDPDPICAFDCVPCAGRINRFQHALKLSLAFGGHLVATVLSRWNDAATGFAYPPTIAATRGAGQVAAANQSRNVDLRRSM